MWGKDSFGFPVPRPLGFAGDLCSSGLRRTDLSWDTSFFSVVRKLGGIGALGLHRALSGQPLSRSYATQVRIYSYEPSLKTITSLVCCTCFCLDNE